MNKTAEKAMSWRDALADRIDDLINEFPPAGTLIDRTPVAWWKTGAWQDRPAPKNRRVNLEFADPEGFSGYTAEAHAWQTDE